MFLSNRNLPVPRLQVKGGENFGALQGFQGVIYPWKWVGILYCYSNLVFEKQCKTLESRLFFFFFFFFLPLPPARPMGYKRAERSPVPTFPLIVPVPAS